ncbi:hypothetical protein SAMN05421753_12430 [Planctomicrobium piriforme]|uniref:Uncharacterized protein n=1 Tax=Planctomicrobium piriforme TaxID=1576369 RepID=A0A1I3SJS1_9PLAN|nr:hypothetical protein SAMN05421753_12430 [Planctomicrobium piriforme]
MLQTFKAATFTSVHYGIDFNAGEPYCQVTNQLGLMCAWLVFVAPLHGLDPDSSQFAFQRFFSLIRSNHKGSRYESATFKTA